MTTLFGIPNCDQVRKARRWLDDRKVEYHFHDFRGEGLPPEFATWLTHFGWQTLINSRGTTWRNLSSAQRTDMDNDKALALATELPALIKRPLLLADAELLIGFDAARWSIFFNEHERR